MSGAGWAAAAPWLIGAGVVIGVVAVCGGIWYVFSRKKDEAKVKVIAATKHKP